jgi:small subunit ribosomal protein S16
MLVIRMRRMGSKKRPFFRVVVTDAANARDGRFVEVLGHYDPRAKPARLDMDRERVTHWIGKGARPSDTVRTLLRRHKVDIPPAPPAAETSPAAEAP